MLTTAQLPSGVKAEMGSGNIFADLELPEPDRLNLLSGLTIAILRIGQKQKMPLSQLAVAMELSEAKAFALLSGDFALATERQLIGCINRLGYDVELSLRPAVATAGTMRIA